MIDRRNKKQPSENNPPAVSETDILLNYSDFLAAAYPFLTKIDAGSYDPWDDFTEPTFHEMVYEVLKYKFGNRNSKKEHNPYGFSRYNYRFINHIEVEPLAYPVEVTVAGTRQVLSREEMEGKRLVFKQFGDGLHSLTFFVEPAQLKDVSFGLIEVDIFEEMSGLTYKNLSKSSFWIDKNSVFYHYVIEDYDEGIQKYHIKDKYAESHFPRTEWPFTSA